MKILTGRYHAFDRAMGVPVAISLGKPTWPLPYEIAASVRKLMPAGLLRKPRLEPAEFERLYVQRLDAFGIERIGRRLQEIADEHGGPVLVLLCWEKVAKGEFCHRRVFTTWWQEHTGQAVPELPGSGDVNLPTTPTLDILGSFSQEAGGDR